MAFVLEALQSLGFAWPGDPTFRVTFRLSDFPLALSSVTGVLQPYGVAFRCNWEKFSAGYITPAQRIAPLLILLLVILGWYICRIFPEYISVIFAIYLCSLIFKTKIQDNLLLLLLLWNKPEEGSCPLQMKTNYKCQWQMTNFNTKLQCNVTM